MPETPPVQSSINNLSKAEWRSTILERYTSMVGHPHPLPPPGNSSPDFLGTFSPCSQLCVTLLWLKSWVLSRPVGTGLRSSIRLSPRIPVGLPGKAFLSSSGWGSLSSKLCVCSRSIATTKQEPGGVWREVLTPRKERVRKKASGDTVLSLGRSHTGG